MIRPPLTTSMTGPVTTPSSSFLRSMSPQARSYWARFLDRTRRPSLSSFWRTRASMSSPRRDDLGRVDVVADRQLAAGDHALGLVADVEQDLVLVDLDHLALDDLAVLDADHACASMASSKLPSRSSAMIWRGTYSSASDASERRVRVAVWSDKGNSSRDGWDRCRPRAVRAHKAVRGYQALPEPGLYGAGAPRDDHQQLRVLEVRRSLGVPAGVDRPEVLDLEADRRDEQAELAGREAGRPEVGLRVGALLVLDGGALVGDAGLGVEGRRAPGGTAPGSRTRRR